MHTPTGYSFEFTKEEARKFIVACKKLNLNPEKILKDAMDDVISKAKEKDAKFYVNARNYKLDQPEELIYPKNAIFVDAILRAANGRLNMPQAIQLSQYFTEQAKKVFHEHEDINKLAEWIWYEYKTNPFPYPLELQK